MGFVCVCVYPVLFIHSCIDGHLVCFHVLITVNNAAVNKGVHITFGVSVVFFPLDKYPDVELLDHTVILF